MPSPRLHALAALFDEILETGGLRITTTAGGDGGKIVAMTLVQMGGDVLVTISREVLHDRGLWAAHQDAVQKRLEPLLLVRGWLRSATTWTRRASIALIASSLLAALTSGSPPARWRILMVVVPLAVSAVARWFVGPVFFLILSHLMKKKRIRLAAPDR